MCIAPEGHGALLETVGLLDVVGVTAHAAQHADGVPVALHGDTVPDNLLRIVDRPAALGGAVDPHAHRDLGAAGDDPVVAAAAVQLTPQPEALAGLPEGLPARALLRGRTQELTERVSGLDGANYLLPWLWTWAPGRLLSVGHDAEFVVQEEFARDLPPGRQDEAAPAARRNDLGPVSQPWGGSVPPGPSERWTITVSVQWPNL